MDAIAGSANKVSLGVVDSSFGVLRSLLPGTVDGQQAQPGAPTVDQDAVPWHVRPGFGLLRRESGFSIASLAASLPGRERTKSINSAAAEEESGQMLVEVSSSRPASLRSGFPSDVEESDEEEEEEVEDEEDEEGEGEEGGLDSRSIRSFESMMNKEKRKKAIKYRKSLSDRLASMPGLSRLSQTGPQLQPTAVSVLISHTCQGFLLIHPHALRVRRPHRANRPSSPHSP